MWLIQILTTFDVLATTLYPITDGDDGSGQVVSVSFFFLLPQINEIVLSISFVSKNKKMKKKKILIILHKKPFSDFSIKKKIKTKQKLK